jgi:single-strand DNA-binding protein
MTSYNRCIIIGNLTRSPEVSYTPSGTAIAKFGIAVNRKWKQDGESKEEVSFFDVVVFSKQAESVGKYLGKGDGCLIEGRLAQRRWETEDGQKRNKVEIVAQSVTFMGKKKSSNDVPGSVSEQFPDAEQIGEDAIPFD